MTIQSLIQECVQRRELRHLEHSLTSVPCVRHVFVSVDVERVLTGPWDDAEMEERFAQARPLFDAFTAGDPMTVRLPPSKNVNAQIALLKEASEEIWEFRVRQPRRGLRFFGRFAAHDLFVALTWGDRGKLPDGDDWLTEKRQCKKEWSLLFPTYPPHKGNKIDDYVSNAFPC